MSDKCKFPREQANMVAEWLCAQLKLYVERVCIAGSIRRGRPAVSDIEILYVPRVRRERNPADMFEWIEVNQAEKTIAAMLKARELEPRANSLGRFTMGPQNKLCIHRKSGIPVDLFSTIAANFWVSLVIRTGSKETNLELTTGAQRMGRTLHAYGSGVEINATGEILHAHSEEEVFDLCGRPYKKPEDR